MKNSSFNAILPQNPSSFSLNVHCRQAKPPPACSWITLKWLRLAIGSDMGQSGTKVLLGGLRNGLKHPRTG